MFILFLIAALFTSCGPGNGPKGRFEPVNRSNDELVEAIGNASMNDSYVFTGRIELYYYDDEDWISDGMHEMYDYPNGSTKYIKFGNDLMPVYDADEYGYYHKVQYQGTYYYY